jgi:allantoate deiminase
MMAQIDGIAEHVIERCRLLARASEEPGFTTRTFLSEPMHAIHRHVRGWMEKTGMSVAVDHVGNLRGVYAGTQPASRRLLIGSHLDTVPHAGAFDGVLGVLIGVSLIELLEDRRLPFAIEVAGFSEEEGVRFGAPFIGSRALVGDIDEDLLERLDASGMSVSETIEAFGLDPARIVEACAGDDTFGYLEFHIEQGPVLDSLGLPLGIVEAICGQSRVDVNFEGNASHAGTTPMHMRRDALAAAAEWMSAVECEAREVSNAVATVGRLEVSPGASNVVPGSIRATLDVRHADDIVRRDLVAQLLRSAGQIAACRCLRVSHEQRFDQAAVAMDSDLTSLLERAVLSAGYPVRRMPSGAGHDAMIMARRMPAAMLFLRSPGGISHHPDECVLVEDVAAALSAGMRFLEELEPRYA